MYVRTNHRPRRLAVAIAGLIAITAAHQASAGVVIKNTVSGSAQAGADTSNVDSYGIGPTELSPVFPSLSDNAARSDLSVNSAAARSFINLNNVYGVFADGQGTFNAEASLMREYTVTNDLGGPATGSIAFYIYGGGFSVFKDLEATGTGSAGYDLEIMIGTQTVFDSGFTVDDQGMLTVTGADVLNGGSQSGSSYFWSGTQLQFALPVLNPADSVVIKYSLVTTAMGSFGVLQGTNNGFCYGEGYGEGYGEFCCDVPQLLASTDEVQAQSSLVGECSFTRPGGSAFSGQGDPDAIDLTLLPQGADASVALRLVGVPEPGVLGLLLGGLGAIGVMRRRRTTK